VRAAAALLPVLLALAAAPPAGALARGETLHLTGRVADAEGRPLSGLAVVLTASRTYFSLRHMQSAEASARTVSSATGADGRYALDWTWDDHYNHFELEVGLPVGRPAASSGARGARLDARLEVLAREDLSDRLASGAAGSEVATPFTLQNGAYVEKVRRFVAGIASDDERRVYGEMGHPDEVKSVRFPDHDEISWWYFESGKVYRFESGRLAQVIPFDPVKPF
jgi:hypothetical protein